MIAEYKRKGLALIISGFLLHSGCLFLVIALPNFITAYTQAHNGVQPEWIISQMGWVGPLIEGGELVGVILFAIGLGFFAKGKGYSGFYGFFGLLFCIGLLILLVLPDKTKKPDTNPTA